MIDHLMKFINCKEYLRSNMDKFRAAFIKHYGEEAAPRIDEVLSKALLIAYRTPSSTEIRLMDIKKEKTKEILARTFPKDCSFTITELTNDSSFEFSNIMPINYFAEFYEIYSLSPEERHERYIEKSFEILKRTLPELTFEEFQEMYNSGKISQKYSVVKSWVRNNIESLIDPESEKKEFERKFSSAMPLLSLVDKDITLENFSYYLDNPRIQELISVASTMPDMIHEYQSFMSQFDDLREEIQNDKDSKEKLSTKYYKEFIARNLDIIPEEYQDEVKRYLDDKVNAMYLSTELKSFFGYSLVIPGNYEMFGSDSEEILESEKNSFRKDNIKSNRIEFFKNNGIDLGDDYEAYVNSEEAKRIWPSKERVDQFIKEKQQFVNKFNNEYYTNLSMHKSSRKEIDELGLLDKEDSFNASLYTQHGTFVNPNVVQRGNDYDMFSLVIVNCENDNGQIDHDIIHELNHLYELYLLNVEGNSYTFSSGWDITEGEINQETVPEVDTITVKKDKRQYELFNEIINEMIAQEIVEGMHEDGVYIFDRPENAKTRYVTGYDRTKFLVADFFTKYREVIYESRKNGNLQVLYDEVGKENFDRLNSLFSIFNENFPEYKYYALLDSIKAQQETPATELYYDLLRQRDEILSQMEQHKMLQELNEKDSETSLSTTKTG